MNFSALRTRERTRPKTPPTLHCLGNGTAHTHLEDVDETLNFTWVEDTTGIRRHCLELTTAQGTCVRTIMEALLERSRRDQFAPPYVGKPPSFKLTPADLFWTHDSLAVSPPKIVVHRAAIMDVDEHRRLRLEYTYLDAGHFCSRRRSLRVDSLPPVASL